MTSPKVSTTGLRLAPLALLAGIEAALAALRGIARGLRIQQRCRWCGGAVVSFAPQVARPIVHLFELALRAPPAKDLVDVVPVRKPSRLRQHPLRAFCGHPGAAGTHHQKPAGFGGTPWASVDRTDQPPKPIPHRSGNSGSAAQAPAADALRCTRSDCDSAPHRAPSRACGERPPAALSAFERGDAIEVSVRSTSPPRWCPHPASPSAARPPMFATSDSPLPSASADARACSFAASVLRSPVGCVSYLFVYAR